MKIFIYIFISVIPLKGFSQLFADKNFYLVDSLNLEELSDGDLQLLDSALYIYHNVKNDTDQLNALTIITENMMDDDWEKYNLFIKNKLEQKLANNLDKSLKKIYLKYLGDVLNNIGYINNIHGDLFNALKYHNKSLKIRETIGDKKGVTNSLTNLGIIYRKQGDIIKALEYYHKGLKIQEEIGDKKGMASTLNNIGFIYYVQGDINKTLKYYNESLKIKLENRDDEDGIANTLNNIGLIFYNQKEYSKALEYYNKSLSIREAIGDKKGIANSLTNIGLIHYYQNDYSEALINYNKALAIDEGIGFKEGLSFLLIKKGYVLMNQQEVFSAKIFANQGLEIATELGFTDNIEDAAELLSKIYKQEGNFKKSLEMYELYITMRDSIRNSDTEKAVIQQEANYQIEKKEQELKLKEKDVAMLEKDKKLKTYALYSLLMFIVLLATAVYAWFRNYKHKKRAEEIEVNHQIEMYMKEIDILRNQVNVQIIDKTSVVSIGFISNDINSFLSKKLSERELEVLHELSKAKTNQEIAETLFVSVSTVKSHLLSIYEKLDVKNRTQAIKKVHNL